MKLSVGLVMAVATCSVNGFAPTSFGGMRTTTHLNSVGRVDTSDAIKAALEASKEFGATSPEARMAWEAVEEMDSADTSPATGGTLDTECLVEEEASKACKEYGDKLDELSELLNKQKPLVDQMKGLASELQQIKVSASKGTPATDSPQLRAAVAEAKAASEEFGPASSQAAVAWDTVEEIAAAGNSPALGGMLTDECLVEALEACEALDELNRALNLKNADGNRYSG